MLLIDCGNTRLKWRHINALHTQMGVVDYHHEALAMAAFWSYLTKDETIWIASVANSSLLEQLQAIARQKQLPEIRLARSETMQMGLINGYREPNKLGVDRWLAMVAAWNECRTACMVIDAGSALTVDWIDADGKHAGGHIVPGLNLQQRTLLQQTARVKFMPQILDSVAPGRETQAAVCNGSLAMAVGYLRFLLNEVGQKSPIPPVFFLTGGDADVLSPWLHTPMHLRPHLVLDGLTLYANENS
jgi:type III pantothenate kinase